MSASSFFDPMEDMPSPETVSLSYLEGMFQFYTINGNQLCQRCCTKPGYWRELKTKEAKVEDVMFSYMPLCEKCFEFAQRFGDTLSEDDLAQTLETVVWWVELKERILEAELVWKQSPIWKLSTHARNILLDLSGYFEASTTLTKEEKESGQYITTNASMSIMRINDRFEPIEIHMHKYMKWILGNTYEKLLRG